MLNKYRFYLIIVFALLLLLAGSAAVQSSRPEVEAVAPVEVELAISSSEPLTSLSIPATQTEPDVDVPINIPVAKEPSLPSATSSFSRLVIPSISVAAKITPVGLTASGDMDMVGNSTDVAWYKFGPFPGELGNAVIGGHWKTSYDPEGVFFDLDKLSAGDIIRVSASGKELKFRVTHAKMYSYDSSTEDIFKANNDGRHLVLITCAGRYLPSIGLYSERLVVFSDLAPE